MDEELRSELDQIKEEGLFRQLRNIAGYPGREAVINGKKYLNFSSNNYLGLAAHPALIAAAKAALDRYGAGGTSSRLISGTLDLHRQLEERLAALKKKEAALVFPSGFQANQGILCTLVKDGDCLVMDRLAHASLWDAAKLSGARLFVYRHNDMDSLEKVLKRAHEYRRKLIVTESVFSMDGDLAPLKEIAPLAKRYNAWTMIDEAHATGIFGERGGGLAEYFGVENDIDIIMGTLSKALGSQGGFVCGSKVLIDYLVNRARSFIYTTSLNPAAAAAALAALDCLEKEPERRRTLLEKAAALRAKLTAIGFNTLNSASQIVPFMVGPVTETVSLSAQLWRDGIFAPAIRPPTVPAGACRLRFSLMSDHTAEDIARLAESLIG
jgi:8-amino-7-oxononanoate synthase